MLHATTAHVPRAEEGRDSPKSQRVHLAHGMHVREGGNTPNQDQKGAPPNQRALPVHDVQERGGGGTPKTMSTTKGYPPISVRSHCTTCRKERGGETPD